MSGVYVHNQKTFNSNQGLAGWKFDLDKTGTIPDTTAQAAVQFDFSGHILVDSSSSFELKLSSTAFENTAVLGANSTVEVDSGKFILYVENGTYAGASAATSYIKVDTV